jgi:MFS transporter, FHS family, L-fucose permease
MSVSRRTTLALTCGVYLSTGILVAALGGIFTAVSAGAILAQFVAGPVGGRFGQRPVLALGMLLTGGGMLAMSVSPLLELMLAAALLAGLGFGGVLVGGNLLIARLFAERSAAALNGLNLFFGVGSIIAPALVGVVVTAGGSSQAAIWLGGALILLQLPLVARYAVPVRDASLAPAVSLREAIGSPALWLLGLLLLVYSGSEIGWGGWVTIYLERSTGVVPAQAALGATTFWAALTAGRAAGALIGLRIAPRMLLLICLLGFSAGVGALYLNVGAIGPTLAALVLLGLACGPVFPTVISLTAGLSRGSAAATSMVLAVGNLGGLFMPALLGQLITGTSPRAGLGMLLAAAAVMLALYVGVAATGRAHGDRSPQVAGVGRE